MHKLSSRVHIGKHSTDALPVNSGLKQEHTLSTLLSISL